MACKNGVKAMMKQHAVKNEAFIKIIGIRLDLQAVEGWFHFLLFYRFHFLLRIFIAHWRQKN